MFRSIGYAALAAIGLAVPSPGTAQTLGFSDTYATLYIGATRMPDFDFDALQTVPDVIVGNGTITTDNGGTIGAAFGARVTPDLRAEVELSYSRNNTVEIGSPYATYDGDFTALFGTVNLWYDFPVGATVRPYAGGGIGFARVSHLGKSETGVTLVDDSDTALAGQLGLGLQFDVGPSGAVDLGYRYRMTRDLSFSTTQTFIPTDFVNAPYAAHAITLGYSYRF
ncbi:outer membrane protein [Oceanomicrobium pacificus]|uniref:Outer membrane beta-barrel protein n=1 Tax=Oceanomicrobium pacificus TaxID=2692916 RepID=A0A6B0TZA5_9RHOB|nr:outer membrane beta-barrel protein [Oceanomicrobium pacificus]MXU64231.1 outer membrane beta-barrel protein [Oceanomicrobium pacificus]